jgi:hypothetical protein
MKQKNRKASRPGKSHTSSEKRLPKENYKIVGSATVIVTCPEGHKSQGQMVSDSVSNKNWCVPIRVATRNGPRRCRRSQVLKRHEPC